VLVLVVALAVVIVLCILSGVSALFVRRGLTAGKSFLNRGKTQLLDGNTKESVDAFAQASDQFDDAQASADAVWVRALSYVPYVGRSADTMRAITQASVRTAQAGRALAAAVQRLPDGLGSLAPAEGRVPVAPLRMLAGPLRQADVLLTQANDLVNRSPDTLIAGPLDTARTQAVEQLVPLQRSVHAASLIVDGLPDFLGAKGETRILFGAENPAEQRGTGGIIGAYSILTLRDGSFRFSPFRPTESLPLPASPADAPAPSQQYRDNYDFYRRTNGYWLNANMTPDFPLAGDALRLSYDDLVGPKVDGVITADPFALQALLKATGPEPIKSLGRSVSAKDVVAFTTNQAYSQFQGNPAKRKLVLGAVAEGVLQKFLAEPEPSVSRLRTIADTSAQGHVKVYSTDPQMQQGLAETGVGAPMPPTTGDFLSVVQNSASGNKLDYYEDRAITYRVDLQPGGGAQATVDVALHNQAPDHGLPPYVIGPFPGASKAGENVSLVSTYCKDGCALQGSTVDGQAAKPVVGDELGRRFVQNYLRVPSRRTGDVQTRLSIPDAWQGNSSGGTYHLTFLNQTTIRPAHLRVQIQVPPGMQVRSMGDGLRLEGDLLVYEGTPRRLLELQATFSPSLLSRWGHNITRPLSKPVLRI
jgi:Protein of unknown function (DUF4012)